MSNTSLNLSVEPIGKLEMSNINPVIFMSAGNMASLCVCVYNSSESTRPRDLLFVLKIPYMLKMENCLRHVDPFVHLFPRAVVSEVPPRQHNK